LTYKILPSNRSALRKLSDGYLHKTGQAAKIKVSVEVIFPEENANIFVGELPEYR
jgi:hypothetical protein